jgi:hypothetical protein
LRIGTVGFLPIFITKNSLRFSSLVLFKVSVVLRPRL